MKNYRKNSRPRRISSSATYRASRRAGQMSSRRGSSASTLARTRASFRYANPLSISMSNQRTMGFTRTVTQSLTLNETSGFGGLGSSSINFGFSLAQVMGFQGGAFTYGITVPSFSEFQTLFDYYKINAVKMTMFFSNNHSSVNSPNTGLPIILVCNDYDDVTTSENTASMYQRSGTRTIQFTADNHAGINHYCKPCASQYVQNDTGAVITAVGAGIPPSQWLNTGSANIIHNGIKVFYNNQGRMADVDIGSITFIFEIEFLFKGYR